MLRPRSCIPNGASVSMRCCADVQVLVLGQGPWLVWPAWSLAELPLSEVPICGNEAQDSKLHSLELLNNPRGGESCPDISHQPCPLQAFFLAIWRDHLIHLAMHVLLAVDRDQPNFR